MVSHWPLTLLFDNLGNLQLYAAGPISRYAALRTLLAAAMAFQLYRFSTFTRKFLR